MRAALPQCETCRFFARGTNGLEAWDEDSGDYVEIGFHSCTRIIHGNDGKRAHVLRRELAVVTDGSGYAAKLQVLPTFGCVLHEARK